MRDIVIKEKPVLADKQKKLLEQDKEFAARVERKIERRKKKLAKKRELGMLGAYLSFKDHIKNRQKANIVAIEDVAGNYGRARNRIYRLKNEEYILFKKYKNISKAKKFMERNR